VYLRVNPDWNLDRAALERRRGKGAKVAIEELDAQGKLDVGELLGHYADELRATGQGEEAERILGLAAHPREHFLMSVPEGEQTDPSVSTE
jgi:glutamate synthase (NADPH/NADH) large chain